MTRFHPAPWQASLTLLVVVACTSVPGDSAEERRAYVDRWAEETLEMLYEQHPEARELAAEAPGILLVGQTMTKVPMIGAGGGAGVFLNQRDGKRTYVKLSRLDMGWGGGIRSTRLVMILQDPSLLKKVGKDQWAFGVGVEAAAKGDEETGAGGGSSVIPRGKGYVAYELTDAGVSATATVHVLRLTLYSSLNRP